MARREIKEIAMIDHAEFSKLGIIQISMSVEPAYCFSFSPEALDTNTACILIPAEFPATEFWQEFELVRGSHSDKIFNYHYKLKKKVNKTNEHRINKLDVGTVHIEFPPLNGNRLS